MVKDCMLLFKNFVLKLDEKLLKKSAHFDEPICRKPRVNALLVIAMFAGQLANFVAVFKLFEANCATVESRAVFLLDEFDDRQLVQFAAGKSTATRFPPIARQFDHCRDLNRK